MPRKIASKVLVVLTFLALIPIRTHALVVAPIFAVTLIKVLAIAFGGISLVSSVVLKFFRKTGFIKSIGCAFGLTSGLMVIAGLVFSTITFLPIKIAAAYEQIIYLARISSGIFLALFVPTLLIIFMTDHEHQTNIKVKNGFLIASFATFLMVAIVFHKVILTF